MAREPFKSRTEPVPTDDKSYRIARDEDSTSLKSSLMKYLLLVTIFLFIYGIGPMIEPKLLLLQNAQLWVILVT